MGTDNLKPYQPGESGNPNGRPKKSFSQINSKLRAEGYEPLSKAELIEAYSLIFNCDEARLKELGSDPTIPYALRLIIIELNSTKTRTKALQDYRDYMFGKAKENHDHTTNGKEMKQIVIVKLPDNGRTPVDSEGN